MQEGDERKICRLARLELEEQRERRRFGRVGGAVGGGGEGRDVRIKEDGVCEGGLDMLHSPLLLPFCLFCFFLFHHRHPPSWRRRTASPPPTPRTHLPPPPLLPALSPAGPLAAACAAWPITHENEGEEADCKPLTHTHTHSQARTRTHTHSSRQAPLLGCEAVVWMRMKEPVWWTCC